MLEGLDQIPWKDLKAGNNSEAIPRVIRNLTSPDSHRRQGAWEDMDWLLNQNGIYFEASAYAVPFLIELAANESVPDRYMVLEFLESFLSNKSHSFVPWQEPAAEAVVQGTPLYFQLLVDLDPYVRVSAVSLLCRQSAGMGLPHHLLLKLEEKVFQYVETETNPIVKINMIFSLHFLSYRFKPIFEERFKDYFAAFQRIYVSETEPLVKAATFLTSIRFMKKSDIDEKTLDEIVFYVAYPGNQNDGEKETISSQYQLPGHSSVNGAAIYFTFDYLDDIQKTFVLTNALKQTSNADWAFLVAGILLKLVFLSPTESSPSRKYRYDDGELVYVYEKAAQEIAISSLSDVQRQAIQGIVDADSVWQIPHNLLEYYGLPADRDEIRRVLEASKGE